MNFTFTSSDSQVNFLDTSVYKTALNTLAIKPYVKPTDMNSYFHFTSYHPRYLWSNIPFGQFLRLKRNSTSILDFQQQSKRMRQQFINRGYPPDIVQTVAARAETRERVTLFQQKQFPREQRLHWTLDYTPRSREVLQILKKHWHLLFDVPGCDKFPEVGYHRTQSLREILERNLPLKTGVRPPLV